MREIAGDIWSYRESHLVCITTNGQVSRKGIAVMGGGVARQAMLLFPEIPAVLGKKLAEGGNHVHFLGNNILSFPVEHSPLETPDLKLISRSATELSKMADDFGWKQVVVPRPGCGGGGLLWEEVRPVLAGTLDDRFSVIQYLGQALR